MKWTEGKECEGVMDNPLIKDGIHAVTKEQLSAREIRRRQIATAMKDPEHLKRWLRASGHGWLVMNTTELIDALPWPGGVETLMEIIHVYGEHRRTIDSGRREIQKEPVTGTDVEVVIHKDDLLEVEELDRAIRFLTAQIYEKKPDWSLTDTPM